MSRTRHPLPSAIAIGAIGLTVAACAAPRSSDDPFASGGRSGPRGDRMYIVQLQVRCDECTVTYHVAGQARTQRVFSPGFYESLRLYPRFPQRLSLSAMGSSVRQLRIIVDGDVVAEVESDSDGTMPLQVEAVVPPPPSPPEPDSLATEGSPRPTSRR